jgi:hypothetical protein
MNGIVPREFAASRRRVCAAGRARSSGDASGVVGGLGEGAIACVEAVGARVIDREQSKLENVSRAPWKKMRFLRMIRAGVGYIHSSA